MARWQKVLAAMMTDPKPRSYTYQDAAVVLEGLGFTLASRGGGSHRKWRLALPSQARGSRSVIIGLLERGHGPLPPEYIKDMVRILRENGLLPEGL